MAMTVGDLVARARSGDHRGVAKLISMVENAAPELREVMAALAPYAGHAHVVGLTGSPGVGKSTTTSGLVSAYRSQGRTVGVLAVDPSSPFTGGALLGDRVRMQEHATDSGVYIRSMGTRGHLGGLAWSTPQALRVLDAAGCDVILLETVGVGQAEVEVAALADTTVVLLAPGMGDAIQAAKAGILEIADIYVVNKADRDGAQTVSRDLRQMMSFGERPEPAQWSPPILLTVASRSDGIGDLVEALERHREWSVESGRMARRRHSRAAGEIESIAVTALRSRLGDLRGGTTLQELADGVVSGDSDPYSAADLLVAAMTAGSVDTAGSSSARGPANAADVAITSYPPDRATSADAPG